MNARSILFAVTTGYLLGSIPFGYLLVRIFRGSDVRETGSGNIGATNVARTSPGLGLLTLLLDAAKGIAAVVVVLGFWPQVRALAFIAAFAVICGHVFPVWLGFRGGKGVATGLGAFLLLTPKAILIAIGIFLVTAAAFRLVSLASIFAAASLPLLVWVTGETWSASAPYLAERRFFGMITPPVCVLASAALIVVKHHANIRRLLSGSEPKFKFKSQ